MHLLFIFFNLSDSIGKNVNQINQNDTEDNSEIEACNDKNQGNKLASSLLNLKSNSIH